MSKAGNMQPLRANLNRTRHLCIADTLRKVDSADSCALKRHSPDLGLGNER